MLGEMETKGRDVIGALHSSHFDPSVFMAQGFSAFALLLY